MAHMRHKSIVTAGRCALHSVGGACLHVSKAFFPRTSAWDKLRKCSESRHDDVGDHLAGYVFAPFPVGERKQVAVKLFDYHGNEILVMRELRNL
jgi:adenine-specific DNA-methyltransferase